MSRLGMAGAGRPRSPIPIGQLTSTSPIQILTAHVFASKRNKLGY